ncbi:GntR family transcriptional regulator / MocR family aminotransferase [Lentzea fradiae]|uniref:GntR family transcriptional regulator / MocR family aminotransferase n=1 Tax=Lentzea fradiae TaxID=200378 RepID=A0A1G8ARZ7_9PSEU|nr:PLP-dependent aminotransferase family protein [Lentzea fradiae]SDH23697.1 GntR family transcriptional regulator / MocR family aminotransferase [Lentzea fradiae]
MESWANLDFHLDLSGPGGLRQRLTASLREAVRSARLPPGTRLPASRSLAADLGIARNTVAEAYAALVAEGWLTARQGSGTVVAQRVEPPAPVHRGAPASDVRYDLRVSTPDVTEFPRAEWVRSTRRALMAAPSEAFGPGDPRGRIELRTALAEYLSRARGVRADPERIVVSSGFGGAVQMFDKLFTPPVVVEEYGLQFHRSLWTSTVPLAVDDHGANTEQLPDDLRACVLTPAHQFPLGGPLHPRRRAAAVEWARRVDGLVLEDDYDGEFRYDRQPVGAVQGLDPEHVVYLGTSSKALSPALRIAWMVLPDRYVDPVLALKTNREQHVSMLDQLTLADFLARGAYDSHVRRMRLKYQRRRDRLVDAVSPYASVSGIAAGMHAVLETPHEKAVVDAARERGVAVSPLSWFRHEQSDDDRSGVVVSFGAPAFPRALPSFMEALAACH